MAESKDPIEQELEKAMPWVGIYIAAASAVCTLAMAADAFNGFRRRRLWFPTKYFSLNATTLTLLAVAMKLPMDLNTNMFDSMADWLAKYMSVVFMSTAMANFMSSLGSMTDKEIHSNVLALAILVITVAANVVFQLILLWNIGDIIVFSIFMVPTVFMLRMLVKLVSIAIMVPTTKRRLEAKYQELHKIALREEKVLSRRDAFKIENLRREMMKYWVMAETSNPQFVMARSVVCATATCFVAALSFVVGYVMMFIFRATRHPASVYKSSTVWIQVIQFIGVVVGSIAPSLRWFAAVSFKCSPRNWHTFKEAFKVEAYWTQILIDCRDSFSGSQVRKDKFNKTLHNAKWFAITFCIGLQIFTLQLSKLFVFLSVMVTSPFLACFALTRIFVQLHSTEAADSIDLNLHQYVILLDGEAELSPRVLKNMWHEASSVIRTGRKKPPQSLLRLLSRFENFNGVARFDSSRIPSLHSQEPPNCWALPVVTLTSIAIALPGVSKQQSERLLSSVSEGLSLAKVVEKTLYGNAELGNIRKAADVCWVGVLLYTKWQSINLSRTSVWCRNSEEVLHLLCKEAEEIIAEFKREEKDPIMENHVNWPARVVAANSMYRISRTILVSYGCGEMGRTDEELHERLCVVIADILAACLTTLPRAITTMCHRNAIEKREQSVREAFLLLGKTEQVVELLQKQEWPDLNHDKAAYIEEWRTLFSQNDGHITNSTSDSLMPNEEHLNIMVDC